PPPDTRPRNSDSTRAVFPPACGSASRPSATPDIFSRSAPDNPTAALDASASRTAHSDPADSSPARDRSTAAPAPATRRNAVSVPHPPPVSTDSETHRHAGKIPIAESSAGPVPQTDTPPRRTPDPSDLPG